MRLARQRYALVKAKLAEAQHEAMGPLLELIDPASLRTDKASPWLGGIATAFLRGFR